MNVMVEESSKFGNLLRQPPKHDAPSRNVHGA